MSYPSRTLDKYAAMNRSARRPKKVPEGKDDTVVPR